ncbi:hypothetical protein PanWU01x14_194850 [Parasponia andersonii]|uniref:Uncharacterized protein n=1 Tax=Parasponia andersonii TaxID=3476 RepID=A0A2P5C071_PARAD|nr:hypothetical protein PanWU01x14_194850 [Parasponia andersonii]
MSRLNDLISKEETLWMQKSRVNWIAKWDCCTKFFYLTSMARRRRNLLSYVKDDDGQWLEGHEAIGEALTRKFRMLFTSQNSD